MRKILTLLFLIQSLCLSAQTTIYVNQSVQGGLQNGTKWSDAYPDLQTALNSAGYGDEIWVSQGIYYPTNSTNRSLSFELKNGVKILGGFNGTELSSDQRDPILNPTRLSGNLGDSSVQTDNSYHVLRGRGLDESTTLDGLIISDGFSVGAVNASSDPYGAGLYLVGSSDLINSRPLISNCLFENNRAGNGGGGLFTGFRDLDDPFMSENLVNPVLINCIFDHNQAQFYGGAIMKEGPTGSNDSFLVKDCKFIQNYVSFLDGGGIYFAIANQSKINLKGCLFESNTSFSGQGGGFCLPTFSPGGYTTDLVLEHCIFRKNIATVGGGFSYDGLSFDQPDVVFNLLVQGCVFEENNAKNENGGAYLVTLGLNGQVNAKVKNSKFVGNRTNSYFASAFLCYDESEANVLVEGCIFWGNININNPTFYCAAFDAGGNKVNTRISNSLFAYNGSAIFAGGGEQDQVLTQITNCTFFRNGERPFGKRWYSSFNQAGAIYYNKMNFYNCVIWEPGTSSYLFDNNSPILNGSWFFLDYCIMHPLQPAAIPNHTQVLGDSIFIGVYPEFVDTTAGDFRLKTCSPAMNRGGNQAAINAGLLTDLDGNPRIRFDTVDIGAYEAQDPCFTSSSTTPQVATYRTVLSPNPANPGCPLDIQIFDLTYPKIEWIMRDAYGRALSSGSVLLSEKQHFSTVAPTSPGFYFIEMRSGAQSVWLKFVVDRN